MTKNQGPCAEMPRYKSHKTVWALKLREVHIGGVYEEKATLYPDDTTYGPFQVDLAYVKKHNPKAGGYYVLYQDGYESFSPAEAFEDGYTRV